MTPADRFSSDAERPDFDDWLMSKNEPPSERVTVTCVQPRVSDRHSGFGPLSQGRVPQSVMLNADAEREAIAAWLEIAVRGFHFCEPSLLADAVRRGMHYSPFGDCGS